MKKVKVLGSGCRRCIAVADTIAKRAADLGVEAEVVKVTDMAEIVGYGVMSTPGVVIDEVLVHAGGIPATADIDAWLTS